jgi:PAS domain-containing protein
MESAHAQKPLELILARNLLTSISTPGFLLDHEAAIVFYNEAAGALLGRSFEDAGRMAADEWTGKFGPLDADGRPIGIDRLQITAAIRDGRPAHGRFVIRVRDGRREIEASAFPIVTSEHGASGAMILFWTPTGNGNERQRTGGRD